MNRIKENIIEDINSAKFDLKIAVSWFTDTDLLATLLDKIKQDKISITIILSAHPENKKCLETYCKLLEQGAKIYKWGTKDSMLGEFMHCKFYIVDEKIAKSGSYNWTYSASQNAECLDEVKLDDKLFLFKKLMRNTLEFHHF